MRAVGVRQAVLERMLRRQKRHDAFARDVATEVGDQVAEIVLLRAPTALSVRNTNVPWRVSRCTAWYVSIHASMPSAAASSARGGRSSAAKHGAGMQRASSRSISDLSDVLLYRPVTPAAARALVASSLAAVRAGADARRADAAPDETAWRRTASLHQARRCDPVRVRRKQGPKAGAGRGARDGRRRRYVDHGRRRAVESRTRDGRGRGEARHARGAGGQRRGAGDRLTANALLDELLGAEVVYVPARDERTPKMHELPNGCARKAGSRS